MRTVGVEEELLLVDGRSGAAVPLGEQVVGQATTEHTGDQAEQPVEHEFKQEQVEIASEPCEHLDQLRDQLTRQRAVARRSARAHGADIAAIATSPGKLRPRSTRDERYLRMVAEFGLLAAEQLTCGQHIHVDTHSRAEGVAVLDRIRGWLPVLVALSANSPFWQEQDTGYASFRTVLWGRWPAAGPTDPFGDEDGYDAAVQVLLDTGSALDDGMIYFDARLSAHYPTVEIRVADVCTDVRDAVLLAGLARALVETAAAEARDGRPAPAVPTAQVRGASWRAARWGLTGDLVSPLSGHRAPAWTVIDQLLDRLTPALRAAGDLAVVESGLGRLRRDGTGAERQRAAYAGSGELDAVVADAVERSHAY
ncbi:MAG TPA: glutamate--cysteine ligase [Jatrophihabitans sp.]|nr:glutamate--cysteine ligase [Jatrophihabitans sp.]